MQRQAVGTVALLLCLAACGAPPSTDSGPRAETSAGVSPAVQPEHSLGTENTHNKFSRLIPPTLRVPSGAVVEVWTEEATDGQLDVRSTAADVPNVAFDPTRHPGLLPGLRRGGAVLHRRHARAAG